MISPTDQRMVKRLVGFWEYSNSLANLDELLNLITAEEILELDDYIKERAQFDIQVNDARMLQKQASSLAEPTDGDRVKRGLAYVTAHARIELASMLAGFTEFRNAFERIGPSRYEMDAYRYLLLDGVRAHYWALANDSELQKLLRSSDITRLMTYSRRLLVVREMLAALGKASAQQLSEVQMRELVAWRKTLDSMQTMSNGRLRAFMNEHETTTTTVTQSPEVHGYLSRICGVILSAERHELKTGAATQTYYDR